MSPEDSPEEPGKDLDQAALDFRQAYYGPDNSPACRRPANTQPVYHCRVGGVGSQSSDD